MKKLIQNLKKALGICPYDQINAAIRASFILKHLNMCQTQEQLESFSISMNNLLTEVYPANITEPWLKIIQRSFDYKRKELFS